jgi:lipopolysaccharide export system protein LptA
MSFGFFLFAFLLFLAPSLESSAAAPAAAKQDRRVDRPAKKASPFGLTSSGQPITIQADALEVDYKRNQIVYKGDVVAVQGDTTIRSDSLVAYYQEGFKVLKEVVASGRVKITQGERVATSGKAIFSQEKQSVVMTENPVIRQEGNEVTGARITLYLDEERTIVEGGEQRVKAVLHPDQK